MNICYIQAPAKQDHTMVAKSTSPQLNLYGDCPTSSDVLPDQKGWKTPGQPTYGRACGTLTAGIGRQKFSTRVLNEDVLTRDYEAEYLEKPAALSDGESDEETITETRP